MGAEIETGKITPTGLNQFLTGDFEGKGGAYNVGVSTPFLNLGYAYSGSLNKGPQGGKQ